VEFGLLLSIFIELSTITSVVHGIRAPTPLAQVAMLCKVNFLGNPGHRLGTRALLPFLAFVGSLLDRLWFGLIEGADALDRLQRS
jgi:hypothetical protein